MVKKKKSAEDTFRQSMFFEDNLNGEDLSIDTYEALRFKRDLDKDLNDVVVGYQQTAMTMARAELRLDLLKIDFDAFRGELDEYARSMEIIARPTDSKVKAYIDRHEECVKRRKALARVKEKYTMLKHFNRAFAIKAELIRTRAANIRRELDDLGLAPPSVRKKKKKAKKNKTKTKKKKD